jgi:hypothetical protein
MSKMGRAMKRKRRIIKSFFMGIYLQKRELRVWSREFRVKKNLKAYR